MAFRIVTVISVSLRALWEVIDQGSTAARCFGNTYQSEEYSVNDQVDELGENAGDEL